MNDHALTEIHPVLAKSNGGLFMSKRRMGLGRLELTASHLIYYKRSFFWTMLGALGMLLSNWTAGKRHLELALADIASVERGKYGFNKNILDVTMGDGVTHRFSIQKYDGFRAALDEELARLQRPQQDAERGWRASA